MGGASRQYTATFAIGARLLGSFRGAMSAAQSRLAALQRTASRVTTALAGLAAFGAAAIFTKLFQGAVHAAEEADQRTRRLTNSLYAQANIRKKGLAYAEAQTREIQEHTELMSTQGVISKELLDTGASFLALQKLGPKETVELLGSMGDVLVTAKGVNATAEDMQKLAMGVGKAIQTGMVKPLAPFIGAISKPEQKLLTTMAKVGNRKGIYDFLRKKMLLFAGASQRALGTTEGRIHEFDKALEKTQIEMGELMKPFRAALADQGIQWLKKFSEAMKWAAKNADWLVPQLTKLVLALTAVGALAFIVGHIEIVGLGLATAGIIYFQTEYQKTMDLLAKKPTTIDPEMFVGKWYLLGYTFTDVAIQWKLFKDDFAAGISTLVGWWEALKKAVDDFKNAILGIRLPAWLAHFFEGQANIAKQSGAYKAAMAEQAAGAASDAERVAAQAAAWKAAGGGRPGGVAGTVTPLPAGTAPGTFGAPAARAPAPPLLSPAAPSFGWLDATHEVMSAGQRAFDQWGIGSAQMQADASKDIPAALDVTGAAIRNSVMAPINESLTAWSNLATQMATPVTVPTATVAPPPAATPYQHGGIITKPTLAMMGERGPEAVVPLGKGGGFGETTVNFSPTVTINGNASASEQAAMDTKLRDLARDFVAQFKRAQGHERRLSYEGGYG